MAVDIENAPLERGLGDPVRTFVMAPRVEFEAALHGFKHIFVDDRGMSAWVGLGPMDDQPEVDAVFQQVEQGPSAERQSAPLAPFRCGDSF